jgi:glyoxylase-like metal-dependent hydrolase (beta-lactamase superfamily II)
MIRSSLGVSWAVRVLLLGLALPASQGSAAECSPTAIIAAAEQAQGGAIRTLRMEGAGHDFVVGQGWEAGGAWPKFNVEVYERAVDLDAGTSSLRTVRSQALQPPKGGARQPFERTESVTAVAAGSPRTAALQRELAVLLPPGFIAAARRSSQVSAASLAGGGCSITVTSSEGAPITAEIGADGFISRIASATADDLTGDVLGDTPVETRFSGRLRAGSFIVPARIVQSVGRWPVLDIEIRRASVNEPVTVAADASPPLADWMAPARMPSEPLGDGVFVIPGRYSALAVDLGDHMAVIEGPQSEARAKEVIAEARRLIPGKPIRYVVNTHAHFDHSAGLRVFAAEGATIVTQAANVKFFTQALGHPRTLRPDALALAPQPIRFLPVEDTLTLAGGGREIRLYRMQGMDHADGMLAAWLPKQRALVEADVFTPPARARTTTPASINPYNVQLLDNIERLGLDVERLISIHYAADGRRVGMDELRLAAGRPRVNP